MQAELRLGNLDAKRDWGFAGDYVRAMWLMLQQDRAGRLRHRHGRNPLGARVRAKRHLRASDLDWRKYVVQDPALIRPAEVDLLIGDAGKAQRKLGWQPEVNFPELVRMMVGADLELVKRQQGRMSNS